MANRNEILKELQELGSKLPVTPLENIYSVPDGYFEGFASQVLARIKAMDSVDAKAELSHLSPYLSGLSKEVPYRVPQGYFENLEEKLMSGVRDSTDYQTTVEELEGLSPLLIRLKDNNPYSVPRGYFENLSVPVAEETKVVSITNRSWFRMAVAASVVSIIALTAIFFFKQEKISIDNNPEAWVAKNMKKVSTEKIDEFIKLTDAEKSLDGTVAMAARPDAIKELVKDIPENEIQDFLNDAKVLDEETGETLMN